MTNESSPAAALQAQPAVIDVDALAQIIRKVDGHHSLGAGALAERIFERLQAQPAAPAGWISVEDRLPTHHHTVLGFVTSGPFVNSAERGMRDLVSYGGDADPRWLQFTGGENDDAVVSVSHWTEIPDEPSSAATPAASPAPALPAGDAGALTDEQVVAAAQEPAWRTMPLADMKRWFDRRECAFIERGPWPEMTEPAPINQCDGCQRGLPVNEWGHHRDDGGPMGCTADRYFAPAPALPAGDAVELFDAAVATELPLISHVEYDSHEVCKHFAGEVRKTLAALSRAGQADSAGGGW